MYCGKAPTERDFSEFLEAPGVLGLDAFRYSLDWLLEMSRRYGAPAFSLLCLRLDYSWHTAPMPVALRNQERELADALISRIIEMVREADRCTRTREDMLWLLLPYANAEALMKVQQRLSALADDCANPAFRIGLHMKGIVAPLDLQVHEDADLLMTRLEGLQE